MNTRHAPELIVPVTEIDHRLGPDHAPVTVVEYGDFECPTCKQGAGAVKLALERFTNRLRFAFRHFPLETIHPHALLAAQAAETAGAQGKFWQMHDLLFANQQHLNAAGLRKLAEQLQLDMSRYDAEMDDTIYLQRVREHIASGKQSGVHATPGFFVNGKIQDVSFGMHALLDAIEANLQK